MRHHIVMAGLALAALAGCSSTPDLGPVFNDEGRQALACLAHQPEEPGARYTDPAQRDTAQTLTLLRYYTAHGTKPYCDRQPPGEPDREWAQTYIDLGGDAAKVPTPLARP